jgi:voltage-dependent potassium channel beta subunit
MNYRNLGKSGLMCSEIGIGSYLTFGMNVEDTTAADCLKVAFDCGINFVDTANVYNQGGAEAALGRLLHDVPRHSYVLATKVFAPMGDLPTDRGLSAKHVTEQCHASLKRLGTDYIDLYQCHRYDPRTPLEETVRVMEDLARQGKILYWGVSEWSASQITDAVHIARELGARPPVSNQPRFSLMCRGGQVEVFPTCAEMGLGLVNFSPLAHGVLTGKYKPGQPPPAGSRAADDTQNHVLKRMYWGDDNLTTVQQMAAIAAEVDLTCGQLALAWCLQHSYVTTTIIGATKPDHVAEAAAASGITLSDDVMARLDALFPIPATYQAG